MSMVEDYDEEEEVGFRFHPLDHELILHYLELKVANIPNPDFELEDKEDIYIKEPWRLNHTETDFFEPNEWYYFVKRTQLSEETDGERSKRKVEGETCGGSWKATGKKPQDIMSEDTGRVIGKKRSLSFYVTDATKASGWTMTEYYLNSDSFQTQVVCHLKAGKP